jgi:hypothetical protein
MHQLCGLVSTWVSGGSAGFASAGDVQGVAVRIRLSVVNVVVGLLLQSVTRR